MAVRSLYLRIYLTVVVVLLVFALVVGVMVRRHVDGEYRRIESAVHERTAALADLLSRNLPPATASEDEQRAGLLDWARRLRLTAALEGSDGHRIAETAEFHHVDEEAAPGRRTDPAASARLTSGDSVAGARTVRVHLADGRLLIVAKVHLRPRFPGREPPRDRPLAGDETPPAPGGGPGPGRFDDDRDDLDRPGPMPPGSLRHRGPDRDGFGPDRHRHRPDLDGEPGPRALGATDGWPSWPPGLLSWRVRGMLDESAVLVLPLGVLFLAIAVGSYPVVRRLTRRLEALKRGVDVFGAGQLSHRVAADGNDEVAALATSFNSAAARIEELMRANQSLLANASHELRSPLARLKMAVEMMDGADEARRRDLRREVDRNVRELDALVEEVLLASRLGAQSDIVREPVDLLGLAADEAARVGAGITARAPGLENRVHGDERLLRRAVRNLLENARRYGGAEVDLVLQVIPFAPAAASAGPLGASAIEVQVLDRGPGVPADLRERIFEPFYRLPGHSEREGGVGLGLSLVRQIALRHGGTVRCEARTGGGSQFVLSLPLLAGPA